MDTARVMRCTCVHEFQDKEYGKGMRLHTVNQKDKGKRAAYCTVCAPNRQRSKVAKTEYARDSKAFGMIFDNIYIPRVAKPY
jgi:hypothetical protein